MKYAGKDASKTCASYLCGVALAETGMYPADMKTLGQLVEDVCYGNAERFFAEQAGK